MNIDTAPSFSSCRSASLFNSFHLLAKPLTLLHWSRGVGSISPVITYDLAWLASCQKHISEDTGTIPAPGTFSNLS